MTTIPITFIKLDCGAINFGIVVSIDLIDSGEAPYHSLRLADGREIRGTTPNDMRRIEAFLKVAVRNAGYAGI